MIEAAADLAAIDEVAAVIVEAEEEGADASGAAAGAGEAADDQLLALATLDLEPVAVAPGPVGGVEALGDDALEAELAGAGKERSALTEDMLGDADPSGGGLDGQEVVEGLLALLEREGAQVETLEVQDVEDEVYEGGVAAGGEGALKLAEAGDAVGAEVHELAVEEREVDVEARAQGVDEPRKLGGPVLAAAGA